MDTDPSQEETSEEENTNEQETDKLTGSSQEESKPVSKIGKEDQCILSDEEHEMCKTEEEVRTSSEEWTMDSDEPILSTQERAYFISSDANFKRRELHGQPRYKEEGIKEVRKTEIK